MLVLNIGAESTIIVTLNESKSEAWAYYLFQFKGDGTNNIINVVFSEADDASAYKYRYNRFVFSAETISQFSAGQYDYSVGGTNNSEETNIDNCELLEVGRCEVLAETPHSITTYQTTNTVTVYNG